MCTGIRFSDSTGNMYFGRNLDWSTSYGEKILVTPRQYQRRWAFAGTMSDKAPLREGTCKHAVIGMGIVADNVPLYFDCANEAGLAIAGLNFPGYASYEAKAVGGKTNVAAYEFPLWVASSFESVDEVEAALAHTAIVALAVDERFEVSLLHWIIGDGLRSITVEYTEAGMQVHHNEVDVLTNQPDFAWHRENLRNYLSASNQFPDPVMWRSAKLCAWGSGSGMRGIPGDYYSPSRFVRAAYLNAHYPDQDTEAKNVLRLFHTLGSVSMIDGAALMGNGFFEKTIYTGGYSAKTRSYYFNTYEDPAIKYVSLAEVGANGSELFTPEPKLWPALA